MTVAASEQRRELAELVELYQAGVWRYLRFLGCAEAEADDLTQETFLAAVRAPLEVRSPGETAAWLRRVARNMLLAARRKSGREPAFVELEAAEAVWAQAAGEDGLADYLAALEDCLTVAIDERRRTALVLFYREGLSRDQVAERLALTADGVKTLLRRARSALRACIERKLNASPSQSKSKVSHERVEPSPRS